MSEPLLGDLVQRAAPGGEWTHKIALGWPELGDLVQRAAPGGEWTHKIAGAP